MKNYSTQNLNIAELGAKMSFFRKSKNSIKSESSDGLFSNLIPNVSEH